MPVPFLKDDNLYLRGLSEADCESQYLFFVNDVDALTYVEGIGYSPLEKSDLIDYIHACRGRGDLLLGIFEKQTDVHVGNIHLSQVKPLHGNCIFGIVMHREVMGRGFARRASELVIQHAFDHMNLRRIQIHVVEKNVSAIRLYERLGAVKEGVLREAFYHANTYHHIIVYAILRNEYRKKQG